MHKENAQPTDREAVVKKPYKPVDIQIRNVTRFSYGETTDGECVIWAQGAAGWFEIQPAAQYRPIFEDMREAVQLLYFITDIYNEPRKRGGGPNAQLIYKEVSAGCAYEAGTQGHILQQGFQGLSADNL